MILRVGVILVAFVLFVVLLIRLRWLVREERRLDQSPADTAARRFGGGIAGGTEVGDGGVHLDGIELMRSIR